MPARVSYRKRHLKCEVDAATSRRIRLAVEQLPAAMSGEPHALNIIGPLSGTRHRGLYRLRVGAFRIIFRPLPDEILVLEVSRRGDHTYADLDRLAILRRGSGIQVVDVGEAPAVTVSHVSAGRTPTAWPVPRDAINPLSPFATAELLSLGLSEYEVETLRRWAADIDIASALAERSVAPAVLELVSDAWRDPARYLAIFAEGRVPTPEDVALDEDELANRLRAPESSDAVAALTGDQFEAVLQGSIDEWMFYLHPSQLRIVTHWPSGPSRVRGGPGTGKTVVALHRAQHLVRTGAAQRVLLTTFVNVLPRVWAGLLQAFAPAEAGRIVTRTVHSVAAEIAGRTIDLISDGERRKLLDAVLRREPGLADVIGGTAGLQREFDTILAGRGIASLDAYRRAPSVGLGEQHRAAAWNAYERYRKALGRLKKDDFELICVEALAHAQNGDISDHLRFDAVVVDEAQDLTLAQV